MNLHSLVSPYVGAVNPLTPVLIRASTGHGSPQADGSVAPAYATPGAITASVAGSVLTVTAIASGVLQAGQQLADLTSALHPNTTITGQLTGSPGAAGTYSLNNSQTVSSETMTTSMTVLAQIQALSTSDLRQLDGVNLQNVMRTIYVSGDLSGVVRVLLKGGDLVTLSDGTVWLVTQVPEPWNLTANWTRALITLQNGS